MPRSTLLSGITLALACVLGGTALGAQSAAPVAPTDSTPQVRMMPAMRVTAEKVKASRAGVLALMEENRRLAGVLYLQDIRIDSLSRRLLHLRGAVTDSVNRDISRLDTQTAETRARRQALEARLASLEGGAVAADAPANGSTNMLP